MGINEIIMYIMMFFMLIVVVDRILLQFGGLVCFFGKFGKSIEGVGGQFEEGFMVMGVLGLVMVGMIVLVLVLVYVLGLVIILVYEMLGVNLFMFVGMLLVCDMGGFFFVKELVGGDVVVWLYLGLIFGLMMGLIIVFFILVVFGIIELFDCCYLVFGVLVGIVIIFIGCIVGGLIVMYLGVQINGQLVEFIFVLILMNMILVLIVVVLVVLGLKFILEKMINGFQIFVKFLVVLIIIGLVVVVIKFLLGWELILGFDLIFMVSGDKFGEVMCVIEVIGFIFCVLFGVYLMVLLLICWFEKLLMNVGKLLNVNNIVVVGMVVILVNNIFMFGMMKQMDICGKVINCVFVVFVVFVLGDYLGFVVVNMNVMIFLMIVGKLIGGVMVIGVVMMLVLKDDVVQVKIEVEV